MYAPGMTIYPRREPGVVAGRYAAHPAEDGTWRCLDCHRTAKAAGFSRGSLAEVDDRAAHDGWHARAAGVNGAPLNAAACGGSRNA